MDMKADMAPALAQCPGCGELIGHAKYRLTWVENGDCKPDDCDTDESHEEFVSWCPECECLLPFTTVGDVQDFLNGITKEEPCK